VLASYYRSLEQRR